MAARIERLVWSDDIIIHHVAGAYADLASSTDNNRATFYIGDCSNVLVEESWAWGYGGRYAFVAHGGKNNVFRRNVARYDGSPDGQPRAGIVLYSEDNSIAENNIVIDFDSGPDSTGDVRADFCAGPDNGSAIKTRGHNAGGWCASGKSLTRYIWEQLGQPSPY
jgi:hypothetical protein